MKQPNSNAFTPWRFYVGAAAVCVALSAAAYAIVVAPAAERHNEQLARQKELRAAKAKAANLAGQLNTARTQLLATNDALSSRSLRLQPVAMVNQRVARLTDLANAAGLTIDEMRPGSVAEGPDYKTVPILIAGNGTYPACAAFLHTLRKSFPDTAVRSFETTNNSASPDAPAATFQFDLVWHASKG